MASRNNEPIQDGKVDALRRLNEHGWLSAYCTALLRARVHEPARFHQLARAIHPDIEEAA
jgi:hypothetical protein